MIALSIQKGSIMQMHNIINDVTGLNPVEVNGILYPKSTTEVCEAVKRCDAISIGGGHYSMGKQTAHEETVHIDLRNMNEVVQFDPVGKTITVQAGMTWKALQTYIDSHGLSVMVMQTYANFTVGGSISVNVHGRYVGAGPMAISLLGLQYVDAFGNVKYASPEENAEAFSMLVGGYGAVGIITEATLKLTDNTNVKQYSEKMPLSEYIGRLKEITDNPKAVFHNADIYPPHYTRVNAVTWIETDEPATHTEPLQRAKHFYALEKYALWAIAKTPFGKWRREYLYDPLIFSKKRVHTRNYEASYDVAELEPLSRKRSTYVLQEYFIPVANAERFVQMAGEVFRTYGANIINISIRHSIADETALLSWSRNEVLAFVVYYHQGTSYEERQAVSVWTRKAIDAAIACGGAYYLPYQPHATKVQLCAAYPDFKRFEMLKKELDPHNKFKNALFEKYIYPEALPSSRHHYDVLADARYRDRLYDFLRFVFRTDEKRVFAEVCHARESCRSEQEIYTQIQHTCALGVKSLRSPRILWNVYRQLRTQNRVLLEQSTEILQGRKIHDMLMLEPTDTAKPSRHYRESSGIALRSLFRLVGSKKAHAEYRIGSGSLLAVLEEIEDAQMDVVTVYGGLHHLPKQEREHVHEMLWRILKPGGVFIIREHDVKGSAMFDFVSLIHSVFNAVTNETWETEKHEIREFEPVEQIVRDIEAKGFEDMGYRLRQHGDPSENILLGFVKKESR